MQANIYFFLSTISLVSKSPSRGSIAVAKAIRTNLNTETKARQYASLLPSAISRKEET